MSSRCPGCLSDFSTSGLIQHLAKTTNLDCIAARKELDDLFDYLSSDGLEEFDEVLTGSLREDGLPSSTLLSSSTIHNDDISRPVSPNNFSGDYFGDYDEADLEWPQDTDIPIPDLEETNSDASSETDTSDLVWEPHDLETHQFEIPDPTEDEILDDTPEAARRQVADESLWNEPTVEKFPLDSAGKIYSNGEQNSYERAEHHFRSTNPFKPFISRMDWEIAQWAKLHNISATAVTELLQIDEVCSWLS